MDPKKQPSITNIAFEQANIGTILLKNRIIRSATHEGLADEKGYPTDRLLEKYITLAKNEVGGIITGYAGIVQNGKSNYHNMLMISDDSYIEPYRKITRSVHQYGVPIILEIAHCGKQTRSAVTGLPTVAPSAIRDKSFNEETPKELSETEIYEIIDSFVAAIERAKKAEFDGVQLHLAHGYLLCQFLSSYTNRRTDAWGGSIDHKFRIVDEIFAKARSKVGQYPILAKINAEDHRKNGMRIHEALVVAQKLEKAGCAGIEVSCGVYEDGLNTIRGKQLPIDAIFTWNFGYKNLPPFIKNLFKHLVPRIKKPIMPIENYNVKHAETIRKNVSIPVIAVGGIKSMESIQSILTEKKADFVSLSRPFICEPNLVKKFKENNQVRSKCIDCNICAIAQEALPLHCYHGKTKKSV